MPARVVDASLVATAVFKEPKAQEAVALLTGVDLYAPPLLAYELTSIARKKIRAAPKQQTFIRAALRVGLHMPFRWTDVDHVAVLELALSTGLSTYDASYLYLSRSLGIPLATFDQRLLEALQGSP